MKKLFRHTPPPWFIQAKDGDRYIIGPVGGDGREITEVATVLVQRGAGRKKHVEVVRDAGESMANAWLIAAAPDQHDALISVRDLFFSPGLRTDTRKFERRYHECYEQVVLSLRRAKEGR